MPTMIYLMIDILRSGGNLKGRMAIPVKGAEKFIAEYKMKGWWEISEAEYRAMEYADALELLKRAAIAQNIPFDY